MNLPFNHFPHKPSSDGVREWPMDSSKLPPYISSLFYGIDLLKVLSGCRNPLGNFIHQSKILHMMRDSHCLSKDLWPCPIPDSIIAPAVLSSGRRRSRLRLRVVVREHLRVFVASCNWLVTGRPKKVTMEGLTRQPTISSCQSRMLESLEQSLRIWYRQGSGLCSDLQRSEQKFTSLHEAIEELSSTCKGLLASFDPYRRPRGQKDHPKDDRVVASEKPATCKSRSDITAVELNPDRLKFTSSPSFKPQKFINDPLIKAGFENPKHLHLPEEMWPKVTPVSVACTKEKLLRLFQKWDSVNCLRLLDASTSEYKYRCGLFAVYKNAERDRQILNPIPENGRTFGIAEATHHLAHGTLLCNIYLKEREDLVIAANDLEDFYHCFEVSKMHAARNHIHGVFPAEVFRSWNAWDPSLEGKNVVGCFNTLAMGTNYAVELAQHTHSNLLKRAGCLRNDQQVMYRHPFPRGAVFQLLCIDDYAVVQCIPKHLPLTSPDVFREDLSLMEKADTAYVSAGLRSSSKKAVRNSKKAIVLGGELDGLIGTVSAPKLRVHVLCRLTLRLIKLGFATKQLLQSILGCWIFVLLFRRPLFALLSDLFHEGDGRKPHDVFPLSSGAIQELTMLCIWGPFAFTNLRASPLSRLFCTDASLRGAGVCYASVPPRNLAGSQSKKGFTPELIVQP